MLIRLSVCIGWLYTIVVSMQQEKALRVMKLFMLNFILLINVKMLIVVGILTFINRINATSAFS